jgi:hypothetical protein
MRFLLTSQDPPFPADSGGRQRINLIRRALLELGEVDYLWLVNPGHREIARQAGKWGPEFGLVGMLEEPGVPDTRFSRLLRGCGLRGLAAALAYHVDAGRRLLRPHPLLAKKAREQVDAGNYDLIIARQFRAVATCSLYSCGLRVAVDVDDNQPELLRGRLPHVDPLTRLTLRRQLRFTRAAWKELLPAARHLWVSLQDDRGHEGLGNATWLPNLPFGEDATLPEPLPPELADPNCMAVIGTWTYSANAVGLDQFLRTAWPRVRRTHPRARLKVGGKLPDKWRKRWQGIPGVELAGYVEDLKGFYAGAAFFIAPILFGGGTNVKVLEGAAFGRLGVVTRMAARGYHSTLAPNGGLRIVGSFGEMATACGDFLQNPAAALEAGLAARRNVMQHYSWDTFRNSVADGVRHALS